VPIFPEGIRPDGKRIIAPRLMGKLNTIPDSLIMIGGGVTGSEFIYMFNALGSRVTAVTDVAQLLPRCDRDISRALEDILRTRGVQFIKSTAVKSVENIGDAVRVTLANGETLQADYAFIAIGRRPDVEKLDPAAANIRIGNAGEVVVDEFLRSAQPHVYAVGDVTGAPMIANRAMAQGRLAARHAMNANVNPAPLYVEAIYTNPEVAQIGMREEAARKAMPQLQVYRADFATLQKAQISGHSEGFCKVLVNRENGQIVGAAGIGFHIADVMESLAVAMKARLPFADLRDIAPANPTISEIILNLKEDGNNPTPPSI
jgi:dihydrolipoamide dehydrogenase